MKDFEAAFGDFIDQKDYDTAEDALFNIVRSSFNAGWLAAGGDKPNPKRSFELVRSNKVVQLKSFAESEE